LRLASATSPDAENETEVLARQIVIEAYMLVARSNPTIWRGYMKALNW